jgi:hypothetical protein
VRNDVTPDDSVARFAALGDTAVAVALVLVDEVTEVACPVVLKFELDVL